MSIISLRMIIAVQLEGYGYGLSGSCQYPDDQPGQGDHHAQVLRMNYPDEGGHHHHQSSNQHCSIPPDSGWISQHALMKLTASISQAVDASITGMVIDKRES